MMNGGVKVLRSGRTSRKRSHYSKGTINHDYRRTWVSMISAYGRSGKRRQSLPATRALKGFVITIIGSAENPCSSDHSMKCSCRESQTSPFAYAGPIKLG